MTDAHAFGAPSPDDARANSKRSGARLALVLASLAYVLTLRWSYYHVESVAFGYQGLNSNSLPRSLEVISIMAAVLPAWWLPLDARRPSDVAMWVFYTFLLVPSELFIYQATAAPPEALLPLAATSFAAIICVDVGRRYTTWPRAQFARFDTFRPFVAALVTATALCALGVMTAPGWKMNLSLSDVYLQRLTARDAANSAAWRGYLAAFLRQALMPVAILLGLASRRTWLFLLGIAAAAVAFGFDGTKGSIAMPVVLVFLFAIAKWYRSHVGLVMTSGVLALVSVSAMLYVRSGNPALSLLITRRSIVEHGIALGEYWETYNGAPVLMRDGLPAKVLGLRPQPPKGYVVGDLYSNSPEANVSADFLSSEFGNFGYAGMIVASLIAGSLLAILDRIGSERNPHVVVAYAGAYAFVLTVASLETSLITGGFLLTLLILDAAPQIEDDSPGVRHPPNATTGASIEMVRI